MDTEFITQRLHISGLTPSITQADLISRLSSFGTVKNLDGFGKLDGLGQPRKFAYVALEGTKGQLAKCTNALSGSTWKGAKLRIGVAKPDYQERIAKELAADPEPPRKKRKHAAGVHAPDMCLVTASNVSGRKGWHVTSMGRMVRPVRMRPERPLPLQAPSALGRHPKGKATGKDETGKSTKDKKKRIREPEVRARRRTIDPTRWDSVHLKGMFLDMVTTGRVSVERQSDALSDVGAGNESQRDDSTSEESGHETDVTEVAAPIPIMTKQVIASRIPASASPRATSILQPSVSSSFDTELAQEKLASLSLLHSLFGTDNDWVGQESLGSDIDEEEVERLKREGGRGDVGAGTEGDEEIEEVSMDLDHREADRQDDVDETEVTKTQEALKQEAVVAQQVRASSQTTNLRDLFAPREEVGFSLLDHLALDLELDNEMDIPNFSQTLPAQAVEPTLVHTVQQMSLPTSSHVSQFTYDPTLPLFFPLPSSLQSQGPQQTGRQKDMFTVARERGWDPISAKFYRTESEEDIRKRWEESKGELTREWKRRSREAGKVRRRRGGWDGD